MNGREGGSPLMEVVNSNPVTVCVPKLVTMTEGVKEGRHVDSPTLPNPAMVKSRSVTAMPPALQDLNERIPNMHACGRVASGEHVLARFLRIVHVVLHLSTVASGADAPRGVGDGRGGVAHQVTLCFAVRFRRARSRVGERVIQRKVVAHLVGDRFVQGAARLQFPTKPNAL